jgi:hypothetical protein
MNKFQRKLRLVIAAGSAVGFISGWALLAHAGKPVAAGTLAANTEAVTMVPASLPPLDFSALEASGNSSNVQSFVPQPIFQSFSRPRLRTGGS